MKIKLGQALIVSFALLVSACGGGGSGGGTSASVRINNTNAKVIAAKAFDAGMMASDQSYSADFVRGAPSSKDSSKASASLIGISKLGIGFLNKTDNSMTRSINTRASTETEACDSGTVTVTDGFDADDLIEPGEYLALKFSQCLIYGYLLDGSLRLTVKSWASEANFLLGVSMGIRVVIDGVSMSADGVMDLGYKDSGAFETYTLKSKRIAGSVGAEQFIIQNLDAREIETATDYITDLSCDVSSSEIGGKVRINTNPEFVTGLYDDYPGTGTLTATGADGTYLSVNADTGRVSTIILTVFDGAATTSEELYWSQLNTAY